MAAITKIEFWKDVGFLEGAIEIPALSAADPINPDLTIEPDQPIMPSKERFFSKLKIREYYEEFMEMSYIRLTYEFNTAVNGVTKTKIFYGWIRDVSLESDGDLPVTVIDWHIDEWRTWKSSISFGSGHVKRRPFVDLATTPIQNYPIRYIKKSSQEIDLTPRYISHMVNSDFEVWWALFSFNKTENSHTQIVCGAIPLLFNPADIGSRTRRDWYTGATFGKSGNIKAAMTYQNILNGMFDEYLSILPSSVNGVWLSPFAFDIDQFSGTGASGDPIITSEAIMQVGGSSTYGYYTSNGIKKLKSVTFATPIVSSEDEQWVLVNIDGSKIMDLPYGMEISGVDIYFDFEPDNVSINFAFKDGLDGRIEGCVGSVSLPTLPVNENALSEYVYSGQREYDRQARTIQSNANAWKSSAASGATGALFGAVGPIGAVAGTAAGAAPGLISYGVEMLYQNDEEQRITDRLKANQPSSLLFSSNSEAVVTYLKSFRLVKITPDDYSVSQIAATRGQMGISVDELMTSCDSLIRTSSPTGYYNIQNLIVSGNVPVSAKRWIREKFKTGVRLV